MKKLGALILGAILTIGIGAGISVNPRTDVAKAATEVLAHTFETSSLKGTNSGYAGNCDITIGDVTWNVEGNATMNPWRLGGNSITNQNRRVYSKNDVSSHDISKVEVSIGNINATLNSFSMNVRDNYDDSTIVSTLTGTTTANTVVTFERPDDADWSNKCFEFVFNITVSGGSNKYVQFNGASFYYQSDITLDSIEIESLPTKTEYEAGEALDLTGLKVLANWSNSTQTDVTDNITTNYKTGDILTENTTIEIEYSGKTTSFDVTVKEVVIPQNDKIITATDLGYTNSYSNNSTTLDNVIYGRVDTLRNTTYNALQLKASTGKFYNISAMPTNIKSVIVAFDADNDYAPSNFAVYAGTTAGSTTTKAPQTTIDADNYVYSFDFSGGDYKYFTIGKTGNYATYIDMIVVELDSELANNVRAAAKLMNDALDTECANLNVKESTWAAFESSITSAEVIEVLKNTKLNTAPSNGKDSVQLSSVQKAMSRYEYIVATYGYNNFLARDVEAARYGNVFAAQDFTIYIAVFAIIALGAICIIGLKVKKAKISK